MQMAEDRLVSVAVLESVWTTVNLRIPRYGVMHFPIFMPWQPQGLSYDLLQSCLQPAACRITDLWPRSVDCGHTITYFLRVLNSRSTARTCVKTHDVRQLEANNIAAAILIGRKPAQEYALTTSRSVMQICVGLSFTSKMLGRQANISAVESTRPLLLSKRASSHNIEKTLFFLWPVKLTLVAV